MTSHIRHTRLTHFCKRDLYVSDAGPQGPRHFDGLFFGSVISIFLTKHRQDDLHSLVLH